MTAPIVVVCVLLSAFVSTAEVSAAAASGELAARQCRQWALAQPVDADLTPAEIDVFCPSAAVEFLRDSSPDLAAPILARAHGRCRQYGRACDFPHIRALASLPANEQQASNVAPNVHALSSSGVTSVTPASLVDRLGPRGIACAATAQRELRNGAMSRVALDAACPPDVVCAIRDMGPTVRAAFDGDHRKCRDEGRACAVETLAAAADRLQRLVGAAWRPMGVVVDGGDRVQPAANHDPTDESGGAVLGSPADLASMLHCDGQRERLAELRRRLRQVQQEDLADGGSGGGGLSTLFADAAGVLPLATLCEALLDYVDAAADAVELLTTWQRLTATAVFGAALLACWLTSPGEQPVGAFTMNGLQPEIRRGFAQLNRSLARAKTVELLGPRLRVLGATLLLVTVIVSLHSAMSAVSDMFSGLVGLALQTLSFGTLSFLKTVVIIFLSVSYFGIVFVSFFTAWTAWTSSTKVDDNVDLAVRHALLSD